MESPIKYTTFGVAAADSGTIVMQAFWDAKRIMSTIFPLAEVAGFGPRDGPWMLGSMVVKGLSWSNPALQRYPRLLAMSSPAQFKHATLDGPPTRPAHVRASIATDPARLLLQQCAYPVDADAAVATLPLARLAMTGPVPAGHALLRALEALHPDAFALFPALQSADAHRR